MTALVDPIPTVRRANPVAGYVPELDAFRAVAIGSVLCLHWLPETALVNRVQGQVSNGVHLFFVLSGFLITRILLQCRAASDAAGTPPLASLGPFYARRFLRIFPLYYAVLAAGVLLAFPGVRAAFGWHVTYLSNVYYFRTYPRFDGPAAVFWTLAVEEQFYLVWPLAILLLPRRAIVPFVAAVAVAGTACRVAAILVAQRYTILTPACANFLAVGALAAVAEHPAFASAAVRRGVWRAFAVAAGLLVCGTLGVGATRGPAYAAHAAVVRAFDQPAMSVAYAALFAWACRGNTGRAGAALRFPPLVYLGRISYGVYVYHLFVAYVLDRRTHVLAAGVGGHFAICLGAVVVVATASWFAFERPINELKRFFPYARPNAGSA